LFLPGRRHIREEGKVAIEMPLLDEDASFP